MSIISNMLDDNNIKASLAQADDFEKWVVKDLWEKYCESKMNNRIIIENKIKELGIRLPNGTVNKEYKQQITLPTSLAIECKFEGTEDLGLTAEMMQDEENIVVTIKGKPKQAGDFNLTLSYKYKEWIDGEEPLTLTIPVAFNADPRTLWKNIPTSKDIPFYKKDFTCEYVKVEDDGESGPCKDIVAASQRGRSHAQEGKARDDHFNLYHCDKSDWYIIVVADGAGSAKFSRKGSEIACRTVIEQCKNKLIDSAKFEEKIRAYHNADNEEVARKSMANVIYDIVGGAAFKAHQAINEAAKEAKDQGLDAVPKDFATTLMFSICKKFDFGWFVASYWVGDGAMCIYNKEKHTHKLLGIPDEGEFAGQTRFLTMSDFFKDAQSVMSRLRFSIEEDFTALLLMTDGVSDPMFETDNNLNNTDKWDELWDKLHNGFPEDEIKGVVLSDDNEESQYQLLKWLEFWSPGNHDDRTIAILY